LKNLKIKKEEGIWSTSGLDPETIEENLAKKERKK
jgi:hypothetical protein